MINDVNRKSVEKNEIKKLLYKHKVSALLENVRKDGLLYTAYVDKFATDSSGVGYVEETIKARFLIPLQEIGEVVWEKIMDAKLLIRWLQN